jgi:hypothetical protein
MEFAHRFRIHSATPHFSLKLASLKLIDIAQSPSDVKLRMVSARVACFGCREAALLKIKSPSTRPWIGGLAALALVSSGPALGADIQGQVLGAGADGLKRGHGRRLSVNRAAVFSLNGNSCQKPMKSSAAGSRMLTRLRV